MRIRAAIVTATLVAGGCGTALGPDPGLEGLAVTKVAPATIIPGSKVVVKGVSFVDQQWGAATLHLKGQAGGRAVDLHWPATFVDFGTLTVAVDGGKLDEVGGDVDFAGSATVEILATSDDITYESKALTVDLSFREKLTPTSSSVQGSGVIFVNDQIEIEGDGFLLGGDEGTTVAKVTGCFTPDTGGTCRPLTAREIPMTPTDPLERTKATFPFSPTIAGIKPGTFTGKVTIENRQTAGTPIAADPANVEYDMVTSQIFTVCVGTPCATTISASLGQYVFVQGGGFVGGESGALTELEMTGTFNRAGMGPAPVSLTLIPEYVEGRLVRYVLNTDDELGGALDLRADTGQFTGNITPIVSFGADRVRGASKALSFTIAPVRQIVYLDFRPSYVEGLRDFGLRAVDNRIRARIIEVCKAAYAGINIEFRAEPPTDYALYEHVELTGVDPNNMGLFGYDNSPGKDNGNLRLYDRLGGVNALTQQDGYPGFGGVFLRSLMGFSKHPGSFTKSVPGADPVFDKIFDAFRADLDNDPISSADLGGDIPALANGSGCPAKGDRPAQIACAIFVLGNLVGGTLSHEIGHSLGLANPFSEGFHNAGDGQNRLMDSGGDRPFLERALLEGQGPGVFCDDEYAYLRMILPSMDPDPGIERPGCFEAYAAARMARGSKSKSNQRPRTPVAAAAVTASAVPPGRDARRWIYGGLDLALALVQAILIWKVVPNRLPSASLHLWSLPVLTFAMGIGTLYGGPRGWKIAVVAGSAALLSTILLILRIVISAAFLSGVYGAFGKAAAMTALMSVALIVELVALLPLVQMKYLMTRAGRRNYSVPPR